ncbi:MAG: hypothetical protein AAFV80_02380 [Bacteroidota bacterium]
MQTPDWQDIWGQDGTNADQYFAQLEPEMDRIVRQRSKSVTDKIRRNMIFELWILLAIAIAGLIYLDVGTKTWWYLLVFLTAIYTWVIYTYGRVLRLFRTVETKPIREALQIKIQIYGGFIQRLKWVTNLILPLAAFSSMAFSLYQDWDQPTVQEVILYCLKKTWLIALLLIPLAWWVNTYYIHWLYGRYLEEMMELYENLDSLNEK